MIKLLIIGVWACVVTLGSSYVVFSMSAPEAPGSAESDFYDGLDYRSTGAITVPIIADKAVKGYILARFVYTIDGKTVAKLTVPPEPFVLDEAFRRLYASDDFDFENPERFDLPAFMEEIKTAVNGRYGEDLVQDILVEQFDYLPKGANGVDGVPG